MLNTGAEIDERFINMYRVRKAKQSKVEIGFDGIQLDPPYSQREELLSVKDFHESDDDSVKKAKNGAGRGLGKYHH